MPKPQIVYRAADTGPAFWAPGDRYTFLVTGEQTGGAYFVMEAFVPPGGGPPPHIHHNEDETFYIVEGECSITTGEKVVQAKARDVVNIPRGTVHCFFNDGTSTARMIVTFTPRGMEGFFEETLEPATDRNAAPPQNNSAVVARYVAAAAKYGREFAACRPRNRRVASSRLNVLGSFNSPVGFPEHEDTPSLARRSDSALSLVLRSPPLPKSVSE